jgi:hypothetical protein
MCMRGFLFIASFSVLAFSQTNASSDLRPVALQMEETNGVLTFSLLNQFKRPVTVYTIRVWTFRDGVPKLACTLASDQVSSPEQPSIAVSGSCAVPRNPTTGDLFPYTAKLTSVRVDGRFIRYEPIRTSTRRVP